MLLQSVNYAIARSNLLMIVLLEFDEGLNRHGDSGHSFTVLLIRQPLIYSSVAAYKFDVTV